MSFDSIATRSVLVGGAFWLESALFIRTLGRGIFSAAAAMTGQSTTSLAITYAATVPLAWVVVELATRLCGAPLRKPADVPAFMRSLGIMAATACVLDGLALTLVPAALYGLDDADLMRAGAWLLFDIGVCLAIGMFRVSSVLDSTKSQ